MQRPGTRAIMGTLTQVPHHVGRAIALRHYRQHRPRKRKRNFGPGWDIRTSDLVDALREFGYDDLSNGQLQSLRIHHVTPDFIRALRDANITDLRIKDLAELRIHDVDPNYVIAMRTHWPDLRIKEICEFAIHGIEPEAVASLRVEMAAQGYDDLTAKDVIALSLHDFEPAYVERMRALGFENLPLRLLAKMWTHSIDRRYVEAVRAAGNPEVSPRELIQMRRAERRDYEYQVAESHRELRRLGFRKVASGQLLDLMALGIDTEYIEAAQEADPDITLNELIARRRQEMSGEAPDAT